MLCHVVWDGMSDHVDSHSQTPRICVCDIANAHVRCVSPPQENPPSTRQKDYVRINALKTLSPSTVWALCRCYWGGPQEVLNKDCWWEMWSHPWCNLYIDNAPIWQDREKESGLINILCRGTRARRVSFEKSSEALSSAYLLVHMFYISRLTWKWYRRRRIRRSRWHIKADGWIIIGLKYFGSCISSILTVFFV